MKLVPENINEVQNFERGQGPKKSMDIGLGDKIKAKEIYENILKIANDPNYPKYMDGDINGDPQDIMKVGDILGLTYERDLSGDFYMKYLDEIGNELGRWETQGADPTDVLEEVKIMAEDFLEQLGI